MMERCTAGCWWLWSVLAWAILGARRSCAGESPPTIILSRDDLADHVAVHVGQAAIDAVVTHGEPGVVDAQKVHDRRVDVVDLRRMLAIGRFVTPVVAQTVRHAAAD